MALPQPMNELQRQAYLRVMGIEVVYPRSPLAGARRSPSYDLPPLPARTDSPTTAAPEIRPPAESARARVVGELAASAANARADRRAAAPSAAEPAPKAEPPASSRQATALDDNQDTALRFRLHTALRFRLHYVPVNEALSVMWEVPVHAGKDSERETRVLLANILVALGAPLPDKAADVEAFDWPMLEAASDLQAGARQAGQAVEGFMAMRRRRDGFSNLLVFASQVASILPGQAEQSEKRLEKLNCHLVCVSSLQAMLSVPAIKREVWQQLQPLRQRLAARAG